MSKSIHTNEYTVVMKKLRDARESTGFTQAEAAEKLGKPQSYISKIERGERRIDVVELAKLAKCYSKDITYFIQ